MPIDWPWSAIQTVILAFTAVVVLAYTVAAFRQAEAPAKPCIRLEGIIDRSVDAIISGEIVRLPDPTQNLVIKNIGSGPALNLRYKFRRVEDFVWSLSLAGDGDQFDTGRTVNTLDAPESHFVALYESLSGTTYETVAILKDRKTLRHARFRRSSRWRRAVRWFGDRQAKKRDTRKWRERNAEFGRVLDRRELRNGDESRRF